MTLLNRRTKNSLLLTLLLITGCFYACKPDNATPKKAENALDAGREFVRASLDGQYIRASFYLLKDSTNENLLNRWEESYKETPRPEREQFKKARILINSVETVSDSVTILNFSNSFKKKPQVLKVIKQNDEWLVDFKYTFSGNF